MQTMHASPPTPNSLSAIPPQFGTAVDLQVIRNLADVIANPLHAYFKRGNEWINIDRRGMTLEVQGQWKLVEARLITKDTSFERTVSVEEGLTSTTTTEREFAVDLGIDFGIPSIGLGTSISTHLSELTRSTVEIRNAITTTTTISASTQLPEALFWFWQLDLRYVITGTQHLWHVTNRGDIKRLESNKDSVSVETRDGEGRMLKNGRIPGARPLKNEQFRNIITVADQIYATT